MSGTRVSKVLLIGPPESGKSALHAALGNESFSPIYEPTIGANFRAYKFDNNKIQLWDTSGNERYQTISAAYYRGAKLGIFVLDSDRLLRDDTSSLMSQYRNFDNHAETNTPKLLFISKVDTLDANQKNELQTKAAALVQNWGFEEFMLYSAKELAEDNKEAADKLNNIKVIINIHTTPPQQNNFHQASSTTHIEASIKSTPAIKEKKLTDAAQKDFDETLRNLHRLFILPAGELTETEEALWLEKAKGTPQHALYKAIKNLSSKAATDLSDQEQEEVALASKTLTQKFQKIENEKLPFLLDNDAKAFNDVIKKYQTKPGWREIVGAIIGAVVGFVLGASLAFAIGPAAAVPAVALSLKGAAIGSALAFGGAIAGGSCSFWARRKSDPANQATEAVKSFVKPGLGASQEQI